jgi:hypothetical protein
MDFSWPDLNGGLKGRQKAEGRRQRIENIKVERIKLLISNLKALTAFLKP